jgi:hypothetical protein
MCVGPLAAISPLGALVSKQKSVLPLISPALAIGQALTKKRRPVSAPSPTNAAGAPTFGPSPSYSGG